VDATKPTVNSFAATSPSNSFNIPITTFTASDNFGVTGYKITASSTPPSAGAAGWSASAPTSYTVASNGNHTLYPWAKDAVGNVSAVYGSPLSVAVDKDAPTVTSFSVPASSMSLTISIPALGASDNVGFEAIPARLDSPFVTARDRAAGASPLHAGLMHPTLIALLGLCIGELWDLEALAADCATTRVYDCMIVAKPLNLVGGVGSPANAVAIK